MTYPETLDYLFSQLPMYQRVGQAAYKADLKSTLELCALLGHPENQFPSIHLAGTNGKGSTAHMLASIFQEAGYKTGLYTSPHLRDFRERIRINGQMISKESVATFVDAYRNDFESIGLSFFEWTVGLAFHVFAQEKVDIAIVETGMGGRLDSTNVVTPLLSIITNIGHDHQQFLGDTLGAIAGEKAGIIKKGIPVIIGERHPETQPVFEAMASAQAAPLHFAEDIETTPEVALPLLGVYQKKNLRTVFKSLEVLQESDFMLPFEAVIKGLENVVLNTGLLGRWQQLATRPLTICDTAHNLEGLTEVMQQLLATPHQQLHIVLGLVNDKTPSTILQLFPKQAHYYFCQAQIPRAMESAELQKHASEVGLLGELHSSVREALNAAQDKATNDDIIFVGGSTFVVAEVV